MVNGQVLLRTPASPQRKSTVPYAVANGERQTGGGSSGRPADHHDHGRFLAVAPTTMMASNRPSSPPNFFGSRLRAQPQHQQNPFGTQYRDDPNSPFPLESVTRGGLGPASNSARGPGADKSKELSLPRRCWNSVADVCRPCCCRPPGAPPSPLSPGNATAAAAAAHDNPNLFYEDHFNDMSWSCSVGTSDENGIWLNQSDFAGCIMSCMVWVLILYSALTISFLARTSGIPVYWSMLYSTLAALALACHVKTTLTDPGSVPASAVPTEAQRYSHAKLSMCSQCQSFKPPHSHHCRICNRCISRMDHHCPWMNNCVGLGNLKHFLLFLIYTWACSAFCLLLLGWNYFFCATEACTFNTVLTQLVRLMTVLSIGAFLFTSSMLMNVVYGIITGIGTIDRLKKKATGTISESDEEPIPLKDVFGIRPYVEWLVPVDPVFDDYDRVMGYSTPQRLLREQMREGSTTPRMSSAPSVVSRDSFGLPV